MYLLFENELVTRGEQEKVWFAMKKEILAVITVILAGVLLLLGTLLHKQAREFIALQEQVEHQDARLDSCFSLLLKSSVEQNKPVVIDNKAELKELRRALESLKVRCVVLEQKATKSTIATEPQSISSPNLKSLQHELDSLKRLLAVPALEKKRIEKRVQKRQRENSTGMKMYTVDELKAASDRNDAALKYNNKGKRILVSGTIKSITPVGRRIMVLLHGKSRWQLITCTFDEKEVQVINTLVAGDAVTISGDYTGWGNVRNCALYE